MKGERIMSNIVYLLTLANTINNDYVFIIN